MNFNTTSAIKSPLISFTSMYSAPSALSYITNMSQSAGLLKIQDTSNFLFSLKKLHLLLSRFLTVVRSHRIKLYL